MKKSILALIIIVAVIIIGVVLYNQTDKNTDQLTKIRIGWPVSYSAVGQLVSVLEHTDISVNGGLNAEFERFTYGAPLVEAALAGSLDVIFVGQMPALSLMNKTDDWNIVGRLADGRASIIVPKDSPVENISDLKGATISIPFGTLNYIEILDLLEQNSLDSENDVDIKNIDPVESINIIQQQGTSKDWKAFDAFSVWDPGIAQLEELGLAKVIHNFRLDGVIVMSKEFYNKNPKAAKDFLKSMLVAYDYYENNKDAANAWYIGDTKLTFSDYVLTKATELERNNNAEDITDISLVLNQDDIDEIQKVADRGFALDIFGKQLYTKDVVNQSFVNSAEQDIDNGNYNQSVNIIK